MRRTYYVLLIVLLSSCINKQEKAIPVKDSLESKTEPVFRMPEKEKCAQQEVKTKVAINEKPLRLDSIKGVILDINGGINDSIFYEFNLDQELHSEGNDGIAFYKEGRLKEIILYVFTESKQCEASYTFNSTNKIKVCEKYFSFINSSDDINTVGEPNSDEYCSYINNHGECLAKPDPKNSIARNVFPIMMGNIPYSLN